MENKLYIGISGKMGTGKTTISNGIISSLPNLNIKRVSMATPIKSLQDTIYKELELEMIGEKDRDLLIALGKWGRSKDNNFWLDAAVNKIKNSDTSCIICDDIRFENEANWFKENGILIRIEGEQRGNNVDKNINDSTETALDNFKFQHYIENSADEETAIMSALYIIAKHLNVSRELMDSVAKQLKEA